VPSGPSRSQSSPALETRKVIGHRTNMGLKPIWIVIAVCGLAAYAATALFADREALSTGIAALGGVGVVVVLALSVGNYLLRFWRWDWYLTQQGGHIPPGRHFLYYIAGFALTVTPGKAGEAVRSLYLKQHGVPYSQSLALLFVERLLDFAAILLLAGTYMLSLPEYRPLAIAALALILGMLIAVGSGRVTALMRMLATRLPARRSGLCRHLADLFESSRLMLRPGKLFLGLAIGLVAWGLEGYGLVILAHAVDIDVSISEGIAVYSSAILAGALAFFLPGGVGGAELVMTALFVHGGAPWSSSLVATVMCRVATLWFAVVLGLAAMVILQRRTLPEKPLSQT
jgi:glycosyltransferase 2 family protein